MMEEENLPRFPSKEWATMSITHLTIIAVCVMLLPLLLPIWLIGRLFR